ncbi:MAG: phenylalanine--tRNA ligase subunit alpha [Microbacteriaceae bacterium]
MSESAEITPEHVSAVIARAQTAIDAAHTLAELKAVRAEHISEKSALVALSQSLKSVAAENRASFGKLVGEARAQIMQAFAAKEAEIAVAEEQSRLKAEGVDVTAASTRIRPGGRHPVNLLQEEMADIFIGMGWEVAEGPELESEWYNFDALNTDPDHPARGEQDTFFIEPSGSHLVLRSQTSTVQIRALQSRELPVYVVSPGRVFRNDEYDATHLPVFHQIEGIAVDKGLSMANLRGTVEYFAKQLFGDEARIRLRPNYFPFTEPSAEFDLWHPSFKGGARWIEWGGCGMVNPNVLRSAGIDPEIYSGFAFGMGIERALMFRNGVQDMRDMAEGDIRFSQQFGMVV